MLPNRIVLIVVLLVYHTITTSPLWSPYYDRYPLTITDRVRYYRLAYVIQKYALSVILISFCVYHTNVPVRVTCYTLPHQTVGTPNRHSSPSHWDSSERTDNLTVVFSTPCALLVKYLYSSESLEDIIREEHMVDWDSDTVMKEGETPNLPRQRRANLLA